MDAVTKRIVRKSAFLFLMLTVSVAGIHRVMMRTADMPVARKTAAERTPVIVLDAGHGEATETESQKTLIAPCGAMPVPCFYKAFFKPPVQRVVSIGTQICRIHKKQVFNLSYRLNLTFQNKI